MIPPISFMLKKVLMFASGLLLIFLFCRFKLHTKLFPSYYKHHGIKWADNVYDETVRDSWGTWNTHFANYNPSITRQSFMLAVKNGHYETLTIDEFLTLKVQNQRLEKYLHAKTAVEAYPPEDRPRHEDDIQSVNFLLATTRPISPIVVARVHTNQGICYIKLDGAHRLIAAAIKKSPIKILFIDL